MKKTTQPSMTLTRLIGRFDSEDACKTFLRDLRWPSGVRCSRCKNEKVYTLKTRPFHWACKHADCGGRNGYRFSVISKAIFENTNYSLRILVPGDLLISQSKKGISALQIHRQIGSGDYRTAWYIGHRIRAAMKDSTFPKLMGEVEVNENLHRRKEQNRHASKRRQYRGTGAIGEIGVIGAIARRIRMRR